VATEHSEHADGAEHATRFAPFDQVDTFVSQIFWLVVTFGALYFFLSRVFLPRLQKAIEDRSATIAGDVAQAAQASQKADEAVREVEARIAEARARARATAASAKAEADARAADQTSRSEAALESRLAAAESRIASVRSAAMANVAVIAEEAAAAITEKLSGIAPSKASVARAVSDVTGGS